MHVAIYAGSFNPIHLGHQKLAEYLLEEKLVDEVWFVVSPCNPLKNQAELIDEFFRLDMVVQAIRDNDRLKASDVEFTMPVPSYTIDTLHQLCSLFPQHKFSLMIGSDNAVIFNEWKDYRKLLETYPVFVYPRTGFDFQTVAQKYPRMQLLNTPLYDISSTEIRAKIKDNQNASEWLHPSVLAYIQENHLYAND